MVMLTVPDSNQLLGIFFKEPFVVLVCVLIAWHVASARFRPSRLDEYKLLNSLPVPAQDVCDRFIRQDAGRYSWVLALNFAIYLGLLPVAPISYLSRLSILTALSFVLLIVLNVALQIAAATRWNNSGRYSYPCGNHPLIMTVVIVSYAVLQLTFLARPDWASDIFFWIALGLLLAATWFARAFAQSAFRRWQLENRAFAARSENRPASKRQWLHVSNPFRLLPILNPLLLKNLVKLRRESNKASIILTVGFVMLAYLSAMNNEDPEDALAVMVAFAGIYSFLFALRSMRHLSPEEESPDFIYSSPISKSHLYFSVFTPAFVAAFFVLTAVSGLLFFSENGGRLASLFLLRSQIVATIFLLAATNFGLGSYPDAKRGQRRFGTWTLALVILTAAFYRYREIVISLAVLLPFLELRNVRFYRNA